MDRWRYTDTVSRRIFMKRPEGGFSWGPGNIPGRRITGGETIVVYNDNGMPNITANDLIETKTLVIPPSWGEEANGLAKLKEDGKQIIIFERKTAEQSLKEAI